MQEAHRDASYSECAARMVADVPLAAPGAKHKPLILPEVDEEQDVHASHDKLRAGVGSRSSRKLLIYRNDEKRLR